MVATLASGHSCLSLLYHFRCLISWLSRIIAGRQPSKRGVGVAFGPDVAERFLKENNLDLLIRRYGNFVHHSLRQMLILSQS